MATNPFDRRHPNSSGPNSGIPNSSIPYGSVPDAGAPDGGRRTVHSPTPLGDVLRMILAPVASLKLTVVLLAMSIFIVFAGTLAQVDKDIWDVVDHYFRIPFHQYARESIPWYDPRPALAWIKFQIFFPPSFFPSRPQIDGGFWFPKGWLIGFVMALNLVAAHAVRFKVQAAGARLLSGLVVIAAGCWVTWLTIQSGSNPGGVQGEALLEWSTLWILCKAALGGVWLASAYAFWTMNPQRRIERGTTIGLCAVLGVLLGWLLYQGDDVVLGDSSMRILWQLIKGGLSGLVLLAGCWLVFYKRAGIVLLHAGIGLLMFSELLVGTTAIEGQMSIREGDTVNFVEDIRTLELAVVDPSDPDRDHVVVVPKAILLDPDRPVVRHELLPFDVQVVKFFQNTSMRDVRAGEANLATAGVGLQAIVDEAQPGVGTDTDAKVDMSAAYVTFLRKDNGQPLGTHLLSLELSGGAEKVPLDDRTFHAYLRFKRTYKPYSVHLFDVHKDDYIGTDTARNYSSDVRLVDRDRGVDHKVKIWMNNPLRFAGETFYQSGFNRTPDGRELAVLQVVTNTGWMIPYVSCAIVATGMLFQFTGTLLRFLRRKSAPSTMMIWAFLMEVVTGHFGGFAVHLAMMLSGRKMSEARTAARKPPASPWAADTSVMGIVAFFFPLAVVVTGAVYLLLAARPPSARPGSMDLAEFGRLPVVYEGRVQPIDTLARNMLWNLSKQQSFTDDVNRKQPAIRWLLDALVFAPDAKMIASQKKNIFSSAADPHRVFHVEDAEVLNLLGLERRKSHLYSISEFIGKMKEFNGQLEKISKQPPDQLGIFEKKTIELAKKIGAYNKLGASFYHARLQSLPTEKEIQQDPKAEATWREIRGKLQMIYRTQEEVARHQPVLAVPPATARDDWNTFAVAWANDYIDTNASDFVPAAQLANLERNPATESLSAILDAYARQDAETFNAEVGRYRQSVDAHPPKEFNASKTNFEAYFNYVEPFFHASALYLTAFVLAALAWLGWNRPLNRAALGLIGLTLVLHTLAIVGRIYISGRPPVTNLYSSAVFIGWGCVVLGILFELVYGLGIGNVVAGVAGFATLLIAHYLAGKGDTFVVLQAVLDTQFWLATHVVCISLGYATTFVAGALGVIYVLRGTVTPSLTPKVGQELHRMIYGTLCFAIFFSFVGTVLGGLWADDSWGRFWGWDPKENGALMIVLWNALVLHARWGGMVRERGLAVLAIAGNIVTGWSWFGVNELGVGKHAYGFTEGVLLSLAVFIGTQLLVIAVGSLPKATWWSFRNRRPPPPAAERA